MASGTDVKEEDPAMEMASTRKTTHRAGILVNGGQVAQDTAPAEQRTERAHR